MDRLIEIHGNEKLMARATAGTLRGLNGIGPAKEKMITEYYKKQSKQSPEEIELLRLVKEATEHSEEHWKETMAEAYSRGPQNAQKILKDSMRWIVHNGGALSLDVRRALLKNWVKCLFPKPRSETWGESSGDKWVNSWEGCEYRPVKIRENPMVLNELDTTYGFMTIDKWALECKWWELNSECRWDAYIQHAVEDLCNKNGHSYITLGDFKEGLDTYKYVIKGVNRTSLKEEGVRRLESLIQKGRLLSVGDRISPRKCYEDDKTIVKAILTMCDISSNEDDVYLGYSEDESEEDECYSEDGECYSEEEEANVVHTNQVNKTMNDYLRMLENNYPTEEQKVAIHEILCRRLCILLGKGGTGKTAGVVRHVIKIAQKLGWEWVLLAPTHAAKKRGQVGVMGEEDGTDKVCEAHFGTINSEVYMYLPEGATEATEMESKLLRRMKEIDEGKNMVIILDESSMVSRNWYASLFKHCVDDSRIRLVLVGDVDQLSPVGPGQVFRDAVESGLVPVLELKRNFRAANSDIPSFCEMILGKGVKGKYWSLKSSVYKDVTGKYVATDDEVQEALRERLQSYKERGYLPYGVNVKGHDTKLRFQVISSTNQGCMRGSECVRSIFGHIWGNGTLCGDYSIGEALLLRKNTKLYNNGDECVLLGARKVGGQLKYRVKLLRGVDRTACTEEERSAADWELTEDREECISVSPLSVGPYICRTVHKSQGLEYEECVYVQYSTTPGRMLSKNLNYTAYSRARKKLHLIGNLRWFNGACARKDVERRNTFIVDWLRARRVDPPRRVCPQEVPGVEASLLAEVDATTATELTSITAAYRGTARRRLPKRVRYDVWDRYIGGNKTRGRCYVYSGHEVTYHTFHVGHVRSVARGGSDALSNLRVICACCNSSMGVQDLEEYKRSYYGGEEGGSVVL